MIFHDHQNTSKSPYSYSLFIIIIFLFGRAIVKSKGIASGSLKYHYPVQWQFKNLVFLSSNMSGHDEGQHGDIFKLIWLPTMWTQNTKQTR